MDEKLKELISDLNDLFENMDEFKSGHAPLISPTLAVCNLKLMYQDYIREQHLKVNELGLTHTGAYDDIPF